MNIKNRLKKLESEIIGDSHFCRCNGDQPQFELIQEPIFYDAYETGKYIPYQDRLNQDKSDTARKEEKPENCMQCKKPVNKRIIILHLVGTKNE